MSAFDRAPGAFKQRGSALTELFVLGLVLVPLLSVAPLLGKLTDVNQTSVQAARYAVWERSIAGSGAKSDTVLATEVNNRFFSRQDGSIKTGQGALTGTNNQNTLWGGAGAGRNAGQSGRLLTNGADQILVSTKNESTPGTAGALLTRSIAAAGQLLASINSGAKWDLENKGLVSANIGVNVANNPFQDGKGSTCKNQKSDSSGGCVRRGYAMLVDPWDASGPDEVKRRVETLVPLGALQPLATAVAAVGKVKVFQELENFDDAIGEVKPDILPPDRYGDVK